MAIATAYLAFDVFAEPLWFGAISDATPTGFMVTDGFRTAEYSGSFTYVPSPGFPTTGFPVGTVTGITEWRGSDLYYTITGTNVPFSTIFTSGSYYQASSYLFADSDTFNGSDGNENVFAFDGDDLVLGGLGDDSANGGVGNDTIHGEDGLDELMGDAGDDVLFGGDGDDLILGGRTTAIDGGDGNDSADGGAGNDTIRGGTGADTLLGGIGNDSLSGEQGADVIEGGDGDDAADGGADNDTISGETGFDTIFGSSGDDVIDGGDDDDVLYGDQLFAGFNDGNDIIHGAAGADTLVGHDGNDVLSGGPGDDSMLAGNGDDTLNGGAGADEMDGGAGTDVVEYLDATGRVLVDLLTDASSVPYAQFYDNGASEGDTFAFIENGTGGRFSDQFRGDNKGNVLNGYHGWDRLYGRQGEDTLIGGLGGDMLYGNHGADTMTGGATDQRDRFIYFRDTDSGVGAGNRDVITDFQSGVDRIEISRIDADTTQILKQEFTFIGAAVFSNTAGELRYLQTGGVTIVQADMDGDGAADFEIELTGTVELQLGDFLL